MPSASELARQDEELVLEEEAYTPETAWDNLVNKDDRTSPEEYPEMALITFDELKEYMTYGKR